jgi:RNA polymerase sigma-70 factor (ECF subfamily)
MNRSDEFLSLITEFQGRLFGYILSLLGDVDQSNDVLQETNLVLWKKSDEFQIGSNFKAWSFRVAHFQIMAFRQRQLRDRLVFDDEMLERIVSEANDRDEVYEHRMKLLETCIVQLPERSREALCLFYEKGESLESIAARLKRKANAVGQMLFRIRKSLIECVAKENEEVGDVA